MDQRRGGSSGDGVQVGEEEKSGFSESFLDLETF
jgi:hypothetical protein